MKIRDKLMCGLGPAVLPNASQRDEKLKDFKNDIYPSHIKP
jgi:hypothetical protein